MKYQLKRAGIGQHALVTIYYVSVIRPVLEYACPVWHINLNRHITESIEHSKNRLVDTTKKLVDMCLTKLLVKNNQSFGYF